jgi:hypothetical protein
MAGRCRWYRPLDAMSGYGPRLTTRAFCQVVGYLGYTDLDRLVCLPTGPKTAPASPNPAFLPAPLDHFWRIQPVRSGSCRTSNHKTT